MTKPWKFKVESGFPFLSRKGRNRTKRNSSIVKKQLKKITSKRRRQTNDDLKNVQIFDPYKMDDDWYGKYFYKRN